MQQDEHLKNRLQPPQMGHLAEQIIARSQNMEQENVKRKVFSLPDFFKAPQFSYAMVTACCIVLVAVIVTQNIKTPSQKGSFEVAVQDDQDWDEFWSIEEETMFAGL